jgi:hypothetical protein
VSSSSSNAPDGPDNQPLEQSVASNEVCKLGNHVQKCFCTITESLEMITKQLSELKSEIKVGQNAATPSNASVATADPASPSIVKPSYSQALTKDITKAVEAAVTQSFSVHLKEERISSSVVMYGLGENFTDRADVADILRLISCHARPKKVSRIGREGGSHPRPVKIEMFTPADSDELMSCASELQQNNSTRHLKLTPWLSEQEMLKVKATRKRCKELNDAAHPRRSGPSPFFVISGVIKTKDRRGKIITYREPSPASTSTKSSPNTSSSTAADPSASTVTKSKNVQGGSQVTPTQS